MRIKPITYLVTWHQPSPNGIISSVYYIRTEIEDLQPDVAAELVSIIHGAKHDGEPTVTPIAENTPACNEVSKSCTIRSILERPEGSYVYYRKPGQTTAVTVIRTSDEGESYADVVRVPACVAEGDDGTRVKALFMQIMLDFAAETTPVTHLTPESFMEARKSIWFGVKDNEMPDVSTTLWNDVFKLPEDFLARYHVSIQPVDNQLTLEFDMDEEMLPDVYFDEDTETFVGFGNICGLRKQGKCVMTGD